MATSEYAAIGIDFGTSRSSVAIFRNGHVEVIPNEYGNTSTASYVSWDSASKAVVGDSAKDTAATNPTNTISSLKSILGRQFHDPVTENFAKTVQYRIVNSAGRPCVQLGYTERDGTPMPLISLEDAAVRLIMDLKRTAELYLRTTVKDAVVSVPTWFNCSQREAMKLAVRAAGLNLLRLVHEPSATLLSYSHALRNPGGLAQPRARNSGSSSSRARTVVSIDLGAGSLDVAIARIEDGVVEVLGVTGSPDTGGDFFDFRILEYFLGEIRRKHRIDLRTDPPALRRLRSACERAKRELSSSTSASIDIDNLTQGIDHITSITREFFDSRCHDLFLKIASSVEALLYRVQISKEDVDEVLLVGGSAKIPRVQSLVKAYFGREPNTGPVKPSDATVVSGAAYLATILAGRAQGHLDDMMLVDVSPITIGIETAGGMFYPILLKNTIMPASRTAVFTTYVDDQPNAVIRVLEGERSRAKFNSVLAVFRIDRIPLGPRGQTQIQVTVELDTDGVPGVYAVHGARRTRIGYEALDASVIGWNWTKDFPPEEGQTALVPIKPPPQVRQPSPQTSRTPFPQTPKNISANEGRLRLETYANKLRAASLRLGEVSAEAIDLVHRQSAYPDVTSSIYLAKLEELQRLSGSLMMDLTAESNYNPRRSSHS